MNAEIKKKWMVKMDKHEYIKGQVDINKALSILSSLLDDPDLSDDQISQILDTMKYLGMKNWADAINYRDSKLEHDSLKDLDESFKTFEKILREGGKRKNMPQSTIDKFIHQLLLVLHDKMSDKNETISRRQEIVNEIFEAIAEKNREAWLKGHPEFDN